VFCAFPRNSAVVVHTEDISVQKAFIGVRILRRAVGCRLMKGWHVKFSKIAAVLAGSVMAAGVAAPAFAEDSAAPVSVKNMSTMPTSINGGVDQALNEQPLQKVVDATPAQSLLETVQNAAGSTLTGAVGQAVTGAVPGASLLGGLPLSS
jgi:hypothetical protein